VIALPRPALTNAVISSTVRAAGETMGGSKPPGRGSESQ
jgi:hypothetical protein